MLIRFLGPLDSDLQLAMCLWKHKDVIYSCLLFSVDKLSVELVRGGHGQIW